MRNKNACVSDPNSFVTSAGSRYRSIFSPIVSPDGTIQLVESGKEDIQQYIDSFRDQTDMTYILQRMATGDTSVLNQKEPMFGDFTNMPQTYAEALQLVIDREAQFMQLPLEVRNKFDNDFRKWFAQSGSEEWFQKMDSVISKPEKVDLEPSGEISDPIKGDEKA